MKSKKSKENFATVCILRFHYSWGPDKLSYGSVAPDGKAIRADPEAVRHGGMIVK